MKVKVWNIKYCLTSGITQDAVRGTLEDEYVYTIPMGGYFEVQLKVGRDAFEKFEEAFEAAEAMRKRKIASLKRKITALEKMSFKNPGKK